MTWVDDIPVINTLISKQIKALKSMESSIDLQKFLKMKMIKNLFVICLEKLF